MRGIAAKKQRVNEGKCGREKETHIKYEYAPREVLKERVES